MRQARAKVKGRIGLTGHSPFGRRLCRRLGGSGAMGKSFDRNPAHDGDVRAELAQRIAALDLRVAGAPAGDLAEDLDAIRRIAQAAGLQPAVSVAHVLETALARGERGALIHGWLGMLNEAVGCDRADGPACDAYVAACSVRLSS